MKRLIIGLGLGALLAASATALATVTISSIVAPDGTINGCYRANVGDDDDDGKGQLRVVEAGVKCTRGEDVLDLRVAGDQTGSRMLGRTGLVADATASGSADLRSLRPARSARTP